MKIGRFESNNIYNEDCYKAIKDIPDNSIDLVYIDIPYDIEGNGGGGCFGSKKRDYHAEYYNVCNNSEASRVAKSTAKYFNDLTEIAYGIDFSILDELCRVMKNIYIYIWCSKKQIYPLMQYFIENKNCMFEILTWHKTNPIPTLNNKYLSDTEYCLMFRGNGSSLNNDGNILTKSKYYISPINVNDKKDYGHPTIKPLEFVKNHILNSTKKNDIILDCFMGSGTTAVACKETGRQYLGFEIDENYFRLAQDRINGINKDGQTALDLFTQCDLDI
jgi:DNA modification methylase